MELYRVLITDSSEKNCKDLQTAFARSGYFFPVAYASCGSEVVRLAEHYKPDALVLDATMPGQDGITILRTLHKKGIRPMTLATTSLSSAYVVTSLASLGVAFLMEKPCECDIVVQRMTEILEMSRGPIYRTVPLEYKDLSTLTMKLLREAGIPVHLTGYELLLSAITMTAQRPELITSVTKVLYPMIAKERDSSASRAERSVRTAIQSAWKEGSNLLVELFQWGTEGVVRPANSQFVNTIAQYVIRVANEGTAAD